MGLWVEYTEGFYHSNEVKLTLKHWFSSKGNFPTLLGHLAKSADILTVPTRTRVEARDAITYKISKNIVNIL